MTHWQYDEFPIGNHAVPAGVHVSILLATILINECFNVALANPNGEQPVNNLSFADTFKTASTQTPATPSSQGEALRLRYLVLTLRADSVFSQL